MVSANPTSIRNLTKILRSVSRNLAAEYRKVALQNHAAFLNAADYALPSITDREHLDEKGHAALADAIYDKIIALQKGLSNVI